jgi:hypothetical protein
MRTISGGASKDDTRQFVSPRVMPYHEHSGESSTKSATYTGIFTRRDYIECDGGNAMPHIGNQSNRQHEDLSTSKRRTDKAGRRCATRCLDGRFARTPRGAVASSCHTPFRASTSDSQTTGNARLGVTEGHRAQLLSHGITGVQAKHYDSISTCLRRSRLCSFVSLLQDGGPSS